MLWQFEFPLHPKRLYLPESMFHTISFNGRWQDTVDVLIIDNKMKINQFFHFILLQWIILSAHCMKDLPPVPDLTTKHNCPMKLTKKEKNGRNLSQTCILQISQQNTHSLLWTYFTYKTNHIHASYGSVYVKHLSMYMTSTVSLYYHCIINNNDEH